MKVLLTTLMSLFVSFVSFSQNKGQQYIKGVKSEIESQFVGSWEAFRWWYCPLLPFERTHRDEYSWATPDLIPKKYYESKNGYYYTEFKITEVNPYPIFPKFFIIEKNDGLTGVKKDMWTGKIYDTLHLNIYDSLFPYDNRFLICLYDSTSGFHSGFFGGNVPWDSWYKTRRNLDVATVGWMRGVQFGVEDVMYYYVPRDTAETNEIKRLRPQFPNYEYAWAKKSLLSTSALLIGAPKGKEDELVEFIWYSKDPKKTGDTSSESLYEMRYILPTSIKSIKERRLEKRKLEGEEYQQIRHSKVMRKFIEFYLPV